jgi:hypothetical protein
MMAARMATPPPGAPPLASAEGGRRDRLIAKRIGDDVLAGVDAEQGTVFGAADPRRLRFVTGW